MIRMSSFRRGCLLYLGIAVACVAVAPAWAQFETLASVTFPTTTFAITSGDFNHDGKADVATVGNQVLIFLGNGDGTFQSPMVYKVSGYSVASADFNGDGKLDLVVSNVGNSVGVLLGT